MGTGLLGSWFDCVAHHGPQMVAHILIWFDSRLKMQQNLWFELLREGHHKSFFVQLVQIGVLPTGFHDECHGNARALLYHP